MTNNLSLIINREIKRKKWIEPDEFRLVRVIQRHQQLGIFSDVANKVLEVHE